MSTSTTKKSSGFTLIELLIVIAIIGVLTAVVLVSVNTARSKARDSKRVQDMAQIKTALELFYSQNGYYPTCGSGDRHCTTVGVFSPFSTIEMVPSAIASITPDPVNGTKDGYMYGYYYGRGYIKTGSNTFADVGTTTDYILGMRLENRSGNIYSAWQNNFLNWLDSNVTP